MKRIDWNVSSVGDAEKKDRPTDKDTVLPVQRVHGFARPSDVRSRRITHGPEGITSSGILARRSSSSSSGTRARAREVRARARARRHFHSFQARNAEYFHLPLLRVYVPVHAASHDERGV